MINKILVTGATGQMGSTVVSTLLKTMSPAQIHVISRKEEKMAAMKAQGIHTFIGDYDDVSSLEKAMDGVNTVLLISGGDQGDRMQEHRNVVDAAKKMGVRNIAYTGRALKDRTTLNNRLMQDHFDTEDYIRQSGLQYTLFQNGLYMEFLQFFVNKDHMEKGIFLPAGNGKVAFTLRSDQAEAMANVLAQEPFENKTYQFTNNENYTFSDVASVLSELSGKAISYTPIALSAFEDTLKQRNLPEPMIAKMSGFMEDIKNGQEETVSPDMEAKLKRKPTSLKQGLEVLFGF